MAGLGAPKKQVIRRVSLGDMRHKIVIKIPEITGLSGDSPDFTRPATDFKTVYAHVETKVGQDIFDGTNVRKIADTYFTIRYIGLLNESYIISYQGNYYNIIDIETFDARNLFMKLRCAIRGDNTKPVNFA